MNWRELLLLLVAAWSLLGLIGVGISLVRGERAKVRRGLLALVAVWVVYGAAVVGVAMVQPGRVLTMGQDQCFGRMCFAVVRVEEVPQFLGKPGARDVVSAGERVLRVTVRVKNTGKEKAQSERWMQAYLLDGQGRRWRETSGVSGNRLSGLVGPGREMVSEPMFRVPEDASGLRLVLTHGRWQPGVLVIGDPDSPGHRVTAVDLGQ